MNGKGSRSRVTNHEAYRKNWDKIFGNPGSDKAAEAGCTCPRMDNRHGQGSEYGSNMFWINGECPVHGQSVVPWEKLKEACGAKAPKLSKSQSRRISMQRGFYRVRKD